MSEDESPAVERRQNLKLRAIFDEAYQRIAPFLDPAQTWGGQPMERFAYRTLRDAYPELSVQEVHLLIVASVRVYRSSNPDKAGHLPEAVRIALAQ